MWNDDPQRLELKSGGGILAVFGLPFLAAGVFMLYAYSGGVEIDEDAWVALLLGVVFTAAGLAITLGRAGLIIDRGQGVVERWWGLLVPWRRKSWATSEFHAVEVSRKVIRTKNGRRIVYPVSLVGTAASVRFGRERRLPAARQMAERVANFLDVGMRDTTGAVPVERAAGHLDEALRDRLRRDGFEPAWPVPPATTRIVYEKAGNTATLTLPPAGFAAQAVAPLLVGVVAAIFFAVFFLESMWRDAQRGDGSIAVVVLLAIVFVAAPVLVGALAALHAVRTWERITVSPWELRVERFGLLGVRRWTLPVDDLEGLCCGAPEGAAASLDRRNPGRNAIVADSDRDRVVFGRTVSETDRRWVHDVICFVICGGRPGIRGRVVESQSPGAAASQRLRVAVPQCLSVLRSPCRTVGVSQRLDAATVQYCPSRAQGAPRRRYSMPRQGDSEIRV
jgi:hypothetical protein